MNIYTGNDYRKIYKSHDGVIPRDAEGRKYEIHHRDGDHENNAIENLQCVSIQEHHDIHYSQEDWGACHRIAQRMSLTPTEISDLARKAALKRVENKTHNFLTRADGSSVTSDRVKAGTNPFQTRADGTSHTSDRVKAGTNPFQTRADGSSVTSDRVKAGTNPFQTRADGSNLQTDRVKAKTHHLLTRADGTNINTDRVEAKTHNFLCHGDPKKHIRYDHTIYSFVHKSGITEDCTQNELLKKYKLNKGNLSSMIRGDVKSVKGWRLASASENSKKKLMR
jgi:hypothetical protein